MSITSVEFSSFFDVKKLSDLPATLYDYITMLKNSNDTKILKDLLSKEMKSVECE